jgi:hypothetical protein
MKTEKAKRLAKAGWKLGDAKDFLGLDAAEAGLWRSNSVSHDAPANCARKIAGLRPISPSASDPANPESRR